MNDIDPHTGYPMKFERHSDRWSPVHVEKDDYILGTIIGILAGLVMMVMLVYSFLGEM